MPLYRPDIVQQTSCKAAAAVTWNALTFEVGQLWGGLGIPSYVHTKLMSTPAHLLLLLYRQETSCRRLPPRPLQSVVGRGQAGALGTSFLESSRGRANVGQPGFRGERYYSLVTTVRLKWGGDLFLPGEGKDCHFCVSPSVS